MNEIGKTSGVGFKNVGGSALDSGKGFNMNDVATFSGGMNDSIDKTTDAIVSSKFMKGDFKSSSLAALSVITTELNNEFLQKDSPLKLISQLTNSMNIQRGAGG